MLKNTSAKMLKTVTVLIVTLTVLICSLSFFEIAIMSRNEKDSMIKKSVSSLSQFFVSALDLEDNDFGYLIYSHQKEVREMMKAESENSDSVIFVTDSKGKILILSDNSKSGLKIGSVIPDSEFQKAVGIAQDGNLSNTDFGGLFPKEYTVGGFAMQNETYPTWQTEPVLVGMLFVASPASFGFSGYTVILFAMAILFIALTVLFIFLSVTLNKKFFLPMKEIKRISENARRGDYSERMELDLLDELSFIQNDFNEILLKLDTVEKDTDTFISNISHDLRTPMTAIDGYIQMMRDNIIPPEKYPHYLGIIHDEVERLSRRVTLLLEMSRMKAGTKKYKPEKFDLCEISRLAVIAFESRFTEKNINVEFNTEKDRITVSADKDSIQQVIYNLIDNAIKFTPENGVISFEIKTSEKKAFFAIENTGDGIPPEELPKIFDRFYKSDRSREIDKNGTGLGLFIAKSIIQAHGEDIWVTSEYKKFCKFVFSLPVSKK